MAGDAEKAITALQSIPKRVLNAARKALGAMVETETTALQGIGKLAEQTRSAYSTCAEAIIAVRAAFTYKDHPDFKAESQACKLALQALWAEVVPETLGNEPDLSVTGASEVKVVTRDTLARRVNYWVDVLLHDGRFTEAQLMEYGISVKSRTDKAREAQQERSQTAKTQRETRERMEAAERDPIAAAEQVNGWATKLAEQVGRLSTQPAGLDRIIGNLDTAEQRLAEARETLLHLPVEQVPEAEAEAEAEQVAV